jgi:hypothetical protein
MATHLIPGGNISYFEFIGGNKGKMQINTNFGGADPIASFNFPYKLDKTFNFESQDTFKISYSASDFDTGFYIKNKIIYDENNKKAGEVKKEEDNGRYLIQMLDDPANKPLDERVLMQGMIIDGIRIGYEEKIELEKTSESSYSQSELSIVFMQVSAPTKTGVLKNILTSVGIPIAGSFATAPVLSGKLTQLAIQGIKANPYFIVPTMVGLLISGVRSINKNQGVAAGYCGDVSVGDEAREGCSVVRAMDYGVKDIGDYCSYVESIP